MRVRIACTSLVYNKVNSALRYFYIPDFPLCIFQTKYLCRSSTAYITRFLLVVSPPSSKGDFLWLGKCVKFHECIHIETNHAQRLTEWPWSTTFSTRMRYTHSPHIRFSWFSGRSEGQMQNQTVNRPNYIKQSSRIRLDKASSVVKSCVLYRFTDTSSKVRKFSLCNLFNL